MIMVMGLFCFCSYSAIACLQMPQGAAGFDSWCSSEKDVMQTDTHARVSNLPEQNVSTIFAPKYESEMVQIVPQKFLDHETPCLRASTCLL